MIEAETDSKNENCAEKMNGPKAKVTVTTAHNTDGTEVSGVKCENKDDQTSDNKENKTDNSESGNSNEIDNEDAEVTEINAGEEIPDTSEFIEFEFSPIKKEQPVQRERSASPDEVAVLDQLYEAAQKEDSSELCNLMFSDGDDQDEKESSKVKKGEKAKQGSTRNRAIINLLKRKAPIQKEHIVADTGTKKPRTEPGNTVDFTNVKNIRSLGSLPLGNLTCFLPLANTKPKRKNPYRTPTPPNLKPSGDPIYEPYLNFAVSKSIDTNQRDKTLVPKPAQESFQPQKKSTERNLIDYSVLTKALSKTLESKLQEGEDNDVKIVIFCNNKPIQSFSVRSNSKKADDNVDKSKLPPSMLPPASSLLSAKKHSNVPDSSVDLNDVLVQNRTCLTKQLHKNTELSQNNIPKVGDVKAMLERNKQIAKQSLAKFHRTRPRTKRISDEQIDLLLKEYDERNMGSDTNANLEPGQKSPGSNDAPGQKSPGSNDAPGQKSPDSDDAEKDEDLEESNLVINDSVATDENCNESLTEVKCDQCPKVFKHQRYLNRHKIRVHSTSKEVNEVKEQSEVPLPEDQEDRLNKALAVLLARSQEKSLKNFNKDADNAADVSTDNGEKIDGTTDQVEMTSIVKTEPVSDSEGQEIQTLLVDGNVMNLLETADKDMRSLYNQENQPDGVLAKDLLNPGHKSKAFSFNRLPPITGEGLVEPVYVCDQCGKFYRARKTLKDHFLREHAISKDDEPLYLYISGNKYQCPICFNNYHSGSELLSHTKKHTGELRSVCKLCGKVYSSVHVLRRHIENIHTDMKPRPYQCELCDYAASNKWHLKEHYRRHTGLILYNILKSCLFFLL